jgi:hypothetical protein
MRHMIGFVLIGIGILLGLYVGIWVMFVGGIVQFITSLNPLNTLGIAYGLVRFLLASLTGWVTAIVPFCLGKYLLDY